MSVYQKRSQDLLHQPLHEALSALDAAVTLLQYLDTDDAAADIQQALAFVYTATRHLQAASRIARLLKPTVRKEGV